MLNVTDAEQAGKALAKTKRTLIRSFICVLCAGVLLIAAVLLKNNSDAESGTGGYAIAIANLEKCNNGSAEQLRTLAPEEYWNASLEDGFDVDKAIASMKEGEEEDSADPGSAHSDGKREYRYTIIGAERVGDDTRVQLEEAVRTLCRSANLEVTDAYSVKCEVSVTDSDGTERKVEEYDVVKIRDSWYALKDGVFAFSLIYQTTEHKKARI
ncbi:MAG: hypothetical protein IKN38_09545 [Clostridia bacterium]|nr:hypothetical protein [Clostridia bacterium]